MTNPVATHIPFEPTMPCPLCNQQAVQTGIQRTTNSKDTRIIYLAWKVRCVSCNAETYRYGVYSEYPFSGTVVTKGGVLTKEQVKEVTKEIKPDGQ